MPKQIRERSVSDLKQLKRWHDFRDRMTVFDLSWSGKYQSASQLAKITSRANGTLNYKTLNLNKKRHYCFVKRWWQPATLEYVLQQGAEQYFKQIRKNAGRKRKYTMKQAWKLFKSYMQYVHDKGNNVGPWTFANLFHKEFNLSPTTIVEYIKVFANQTKLLVEGHHLDEHNKKCRLQSGKFWMKLGKKYYFGSTASIDEATLYTKEIVSRAYIYKPNGIYQSRLFEQRAKEARFHRNDPIITINNIKNIDNPVKDIDTWPMPPLPTLRVS